MAEKSTEVAIVMPPEDRLAVIFKAEKNDEAEALIAKIEKEVRSFVPDLSTKKGRDAIASLAYRVARSKTALDDAGKKLTEEQQKTIDRVNATRRLFRERLDALKAEARGPLDKWEADEKKRLEDLKIRLESLEQIKVGRGDGSEAIAAEIARVEAVAINDEWGEYLPMAAKAKDVALVNLRRDLDAEKKAEEERAELERLRAEAARREAEAEEKRKREEAAAALKKRADDLVEHIRQCAGGRIHGQTQEPGILVYELEQRVAPQIGPELGEHEERVADAYDAAIDHVRAKKAEAVKAEAKRLEKERQEAAEKAAEEARREAAERAERDKREAEEKAERERQDAREREERLKRERDEADKRAREDAERREAERKAAEDRRRADERHRAKITGEIADAIASILELEFGAKQFSQDIAEAIVAGKVPHVEAKL